MPTADDGGPLTVHSDSPFSGVQYEGFCLEGSWIDGSFPSD